MSAQEELDRLKKVEQEMRSINSPYSVVRAPTEIAISAWADRIAAIREGLGKAQGEPFGYLHIVPGRMPDFHFKAVAHEEMIPVYIRPQADYAQASMEAILLAGNGLSNAAYNLSQFDAIAADTRAQLRNAVKKWDDALAAHKSEAKG